MLNVSIHNTFLRISKIFDDFWYIYNYIIVFWKTSNNDKKNYLEINCLKRENSEQIGVFKILFSKKISY